MPTPDLAPTDLHIPLTTLAPWVTSIACGVGAAFFGLWNKSQSKDIRDITEDIKALEVDRKLQEERFDKRETANRHDIGAQLGVIIARQDATDKRHMELLAGWNECRATHERDQVRRSDFDLMRQDIKSIFERVDAIKESMVAFHARYGVHDK